MSSPAHGLAQDTPRNRFASHTVSSLFKSFFNAVTYYGSHIDLVVCSLRFGDSRMFNFLRRPDARFAKDVRPCPCANVHEQMPSKSTILSVDMASRSPEAARFIELSRWRADAETQGQLQISASCREDAERNVKLGQPAKRARRFRRKQTCGLKDAATGGAGVRTR
jgi:hypothetical protein